MNQYLKQKIIIKKLKVKTKTIEIISEYKSVLADLKCQCSKYNNTWITNWNSLRMTPKCPECEVKRIIWSMNKISDYLESYYPNIYLVSYEYINIKSDLEFECECGHKFKRTWNNFLSGHGCKKCKNGLKELKEVC